MRLRLIRFATFAPLVLVACVEGSSDQPIAETSTSEADTNDGDPDSSACMAAPRTVAYGEAIMLAAGTNPRGVTLGDVDDDGNLDVLATARDDRQLLAFLGHGDGSFATPRVSALADGTFPEALRGGAIADDVFDLVSRAMADDLVLVRMRGDGHGEFPEQELLSVPSPIFILGHATNDAVLDVILPTSGALLVYPGSPEQEAFTAAAIESSGSWANPSAVGLGDFDGDGDQDVALASVGELHVGLNDGTAAFSFAAPLEFFGNPSDLETGDLDGDGDLEIMLTTYAGADAGHVFRGHGDGSFSADEIIAAPTSPICLAVADIDDDGRDDLAIVGAEIMAVYLSTGDGFGPAMQASCAGQDPRQLSLGDLNGDCIEDVVTVTSEGVCMMLSTTP
jgi:hypothetical protein